MQPWPSLGTEKENSSPKPTQKSETEGPSVPKPGPFIIWGRNGGPGGGLYLPRSTSQAQSPGLLIPNLILKAHSLLFLQDLCSDSLEKHFGGRLV